MSKFKTTPKTRAQLLAEFEATPLDGYVSEQHISAVRNCSRALVQLERVRGSGIPFFKDGTRVLYRKSDGVEYLHSRLRRYRSTSEYASQYPDAAPASLKTCNTTSQNPTTTPPGNRRRKSHLPNAA